MGDRQNRYRARRKLKGYIAVTTFITDELKEEIREFARENRVSLERAYRLIIKKGLDDLL